MVETENKHTQQEGTALSLLSLRFSSRYTDVTKKQTQRHSNKKLKWSGPRRRAVMVL